MARAARSRAVISSVGSCPAQRSAKGSPVARRHRRRHPSPPARAAWSAPAASRRTRSAAGWSPRSPRRRRAAGATRRTGRRRRRAGWSRPRRRPGLRPRPMMGRPGTIIPTAWKDGERIPTMSQRFGKDRPRCGSEASSAAPEALRDGRHRHRVAAAPRQPGQDGAQRRAPRIGLLARFGQSRPGFERALPEPREARPAALGQQGEVGEPVDVGPRQPPDRQHVARRVGLGRKAEQAEFRRRAGRAWSRGSAPPGRRRRSPASPPASAASTAGAARPKSRMRSAWSMSRAKAPATSDRRPRATMRSSAICAPRRWPWTRPRAKARSVSVSASIQGTRWSFQRIVTGRWSASPVRGSAASRPSVPTSRGSQGGAARQHAQQPPAAAPEAAARVPVPIAATPAPRRPPHAAYASPR